MTTTLDFIEQMRQKYGVGNNGPTLHPVSPTPVRYGLNPEDFAMPNTDQGAAPGGMRYTGRSADGSINPSSPAGIVHEGEMVVEKPMVDAMGGPEKARKGMEQVAGRGMRGFQEGTGAGTADNPVVHILNLPDPTQRASSNYSNVTRTGIAGIENIAAGRNAAVDTSVAEAINRTAGTGSAAQQVLQQRLAQSGTGEGASRVALAMQTRDTQEQISGIRSAGAVEKAREAQAASTQLAVS